MKTKKKFKLYLISAFSIITLLVLYQNCIVSTPTNQRTTSGTSSSTSSTTTNSNPTDISLSSTSIAEEMPINSTVGFFATTDSDTRQTFTYTLVEGTGSTNNSSFSISNQQLLTKEIFDYETKSSYSIRVKTTDSAGGTYEKIFTITITQTTWYQSLLAGHSGGIGNVDSTSTASRFYAPGWLTTDGNNLFITDYKNHNIRKMVISSGEVSTLAGLALTTGSSNGIGTGARFKGLTGVTTDGSFLYISDTSNDTIRKVSTSNGVTYTLAGTAGSSGVTNATGADARFKSPMGITSDGTNLYVCDYGNNQIRAIAISSGVVTQFTTSGESLSGPMGITSDGTNLYVTNNTNYKILKIVISTKVASVFAGSGTNGFANATSSAANFSTVTGIAYDGTYIYVADTGNHTIRKIDSSGVVTTLAGGEGSANSGFVDGTGTVARFNTPTGLIVDSTNTYLYVADVGNLSIRKITLSTGAVTTVAGGGPLTQGTTDSTTNTSVRFNYPTGITSNGTYLFVADRGSHTIRKIKIASGETTTLAGTAGTSGSTNATGTSAKFYLPNDLTTDGSYLYAADSSNNLIRKISISTGAVTTLAGDGGIVIFKNPRGITTDGTYLYVADTEKHRIRKIIIDTGEVSTLAGTGIAGSLDHDTGTSATFNYPVGITTDGTNLFVADAYNHTIRKIVIATGVVSTLAGTASTSGYTDGTGTAAKFYYPLGISTNGTYLFVHDCGNHVFRKIDITTKEVTTFWGNNSYFGFKEGTSGYIPYFDNVLYPCSEMYNYKVHYDEDLDNFYFSFPSGVGKIIRQ